MRLPRAPLATAMVAAVCAASLAGCGAVTPSPSTVDPANKAPANSSLFLALTVRPRGQLQQNLTRLLDRAGDPRATATTSQWILDELQAAGAHLQTLDAWLGRRVGLAIVGVPGRHLDESSALNHLVLIIPTSNPGAARSFLAQTTNTSELAARLSGNYVLIGGPTALAVAAATTPAASLAASHGYRAALRELAPGRLAVIYLHQGRLAELEQALVSLISPASKSSGSPGLRRSQVSTAPALMKQLAASNEVTVAGLEVSDAALKLDVITRGIRDPTLARSRATALVQRLLRLVPGSLKGRSIRVGRSVRLLHVLARPRRHPISAHLRRLAVSGGTTHWRLVVSVG